MERLNTVLPNGTFGMAVSSINTNFSLIVSAINGLEYSSTKSKGIRDYGFIPSTETLPNAANGDWCMVLSEGNTFPATIWTFDGTTWSQGGTWDPEGIDLSSYAKTTEMTDAIAASLAQAIAQIGYAEVTVSGTTLSASLQNYVLPTSGGTIHLKMSAPGTGASTLNINNTGAKELWYNGAAVSDGNTWEANEIISVFYDGTRYMASNSQGGGKADSQLDENSTLPVQNKVVTQAINTISANLQMLEDMINFNGVGNGASTFVETELKPIKKGNYTIKVNGSISKANKVSNTSPYFRIDFYAADGTTLVKYIYMACQQSGGSYTADYIDYGATITQKTMEVEIPQDGYVRVTHRITTASNFTVVVSQSTAVKGELSEEVYTNYPLTQQRVIQGIYRTYYSDIVVRTTRVMAFLDVSNIKSVKISPASGFTFSLATFSENYMNAQVGDVIPTDTRTYYDAEYVNTGRTTQLTDNDKTLFVIIAKSDGSDIDVTTITDDVLTIECAIDKKKLQKGVNANKKKANVLFIGNSLLQDAVAYLPLYMKELAPEVDFNFYLWYNSGYHLSQQLADFNNNVAADIFSVNVGAGWMQHPNSKTMAQVLSEYEFDIVVIQEYFYYFYVNNLPYTDNDLQVFFDTITWIEDHYNKPFKVATFFHPPRLTDQATADASFTFEKDNIVKILQKTTVESMLTSGIAIYRAMATSLDSLGDTGHLSADNVHSQEGLPCMLTAWTSALWLMEEMGVPMSVNNVQTIVDSSNYASINVPGPNLGSGIVVGSTAQVRLAQQVAIKAYKEGKALFNANLTENI